MGRHAQRGRQPPKREVSQEDSSTLTEYDIRNDDDGRTPLLDALIRSDLALVQVTSLLYLWSPER